MLFYDAQEVALHHIRKSMVQVLTLCVHVRFQAQSKRFTVISKTLAPVKFVFASASVL